MATDETAPDLLDLPRLPAGFRFGASTASYQIEGSVGADGRGPSVWDTFCAEPGRVRDGSSGANACDSYRRWRDDVALLADLGAHAYRFSIAWPRILPTGRGEVNSAGLDHYDRFVDALLEAGIDPMVTLFHWDLPQALETGPGAGEGGWMDRATAEAFGEYAAVVGERLADRVAAWMPVNEPNVVTVLGYASGIHAPGRTLALDALPVAHHLLLGHGLAVAALRAAGARSVGTAHNLSPVWPASADPADVRAAAAYDELWNRLFTDPVLLGRYPEGLVEAVPVPPGGDLAEDLALISAPLDFFGFNYYQPTAVRAPGSVDLEGLGPPVAAGMPVGMPFELAPMPSYPVTDFGWPIVPEGLHEQLLLLAERYPDLPPVWITEQGCAFNVGPSGPEGARVVEDQARIDYLDGHLRAVARAIEDGVDVRGYLSWSLLDNFEWAEGYTQRFGLVWVDFETGERIPKRSFDWYAGVIAAHRGADPVQGTV